MLKKIFSRTNSMISNPHSMPILNTDLIFNHSIREEQAQLQEFEIKAYARE